jgi:hypothetical protein
MDICKNIKGFLTPTLSLFLANNVTFFANMVKMCPKFYWKIDMPGFRTLLLLLLWGLSCTAFAQVYKSTDAEGNVVFSDTPVEGGEEVNIPETNVADPVEVPAYVPPAPEPQVVEQQPPPEVISDEDNRDGGRSRRGWRHRPRAGHHK